MPRVVVDELTPGWYLSGNVYNQNGLILLTAGMRLKESYIRRLQELGVRAVDVQPPALKHVRPRDILGPELRSQSAMAVAQVLATVKQGNPNPEPVMPFVHRIVDRVLQNHDVMLGLTDIRAHDAYTHAHSVNVCMLAAMIGKCLRLARTDLTELATGAILHDLGKVFIDTKILNKRGPLSGEEFEIVKHHAQGGYAALVAHPQIGERAALVIQQHHERCDGNGYPEGLKGSAISLFARITAVADVYDAVSSDRPYRAALSPVDCIRLLTKDESGRLWRQAVEALTSCVAPYPEACTVRLNTGELAVVNLCYPSAPYRPQITVFADARGQPWPLPRMVELLRSPNLSVEDIVSMDRLSQMLSLEDYEMPVASAAGAC